MPDKDDFTFDENDDFPETDLSSAFEEGEQQAPEPSEYKELPPAAAKGSSKSRVLLLVLLLIVAIGAGAYYFMGLGGTSPEVTQAPPKAKKTVALPPKPAKAPVPPPPKPVEPPKEQSDADKVAVPAPPAPKEEKPAAMPVDATPEASAPAVAAPSATPPAETVEESVDKQSGTSVPPSELGADEASPQILSGDYVLDAGSYLLAGNRKTLEEKLRSLGYEPRISPVDAKVTMTRLRLGTFPPDQAAEALEYAKKIASSAFSLPEGDQVVIYAGTFYNQQNVEKLRERFAQEGITGQYEPIEVVRTLSRVTFGAFETREAAERAADQAANAGVQVTVVKK